LFNIVKNKNEFPSDWKVAIICPILRAKEILKNQEFIEVFGYYQFWGKIFSGILAGRLRDWLSNHEVLWRFKQDS
jgi:hypothetical protein